LEEIKKKQCPECNSFKIQVDLSTGEEVCISCGYILEDNLIDSGPVSSRDSAGNYILTNRTPIKLSTINFGLNTSFIDNLGSKKNFRLYKAQSLSTPAIERKIHIKLKDMKRACSILKIPSYIEEDIAVYYRHIVYHNLLRGKITEGIIGGLIYLLCNCNYVPRKMNEVAEVMGVSRRKLNRHIKYVHSLNLIKHTIITPSSYFPRLISELGLNNKILPILEDILMECTKHNLICGKSPLTLASAIIYLGCIVHGQHRTQREICKVSDTSEVTLRARVKEILEKTNLENKFVKYK